MDTGPVTLPQPKPFKTILEIGTILGFKLYPSDPKIAPVEVPEWYILKHKPQNGGFYVETFDGEQTYCPRDFFYTCFLSAAS